MIHVRVQTWFPLQIQIYLNGRDWLARKLAAPEIRCTKLDNVFAWFEDLPQAQRLANRFSQFDWPRILNRYVSATDVMFKTGAGLRDLYPRLLSHSTLCFGAKEVINFLGRK